MLVGPILGDRSIQELAAVDVRVQQPSEFIVISQAQTASLSGLSSC